MLLPRTRAWTVGQRWLIIAVVATGLLCFGTLVYSYERYRRGPSETVLYGTWQVPLGDDYVYFQFDPKGAFSILSLSEGDATPIVKGRWYAGGPNIYLRFIEGWDEVAARRPLILHIVDIEPNELRVRFRRDDVQSYKRVTLASPPRI